MHALSEMTRQLIFRRRSLVTSEPFPSTRRVGASRLVAQGASGIKYSPIINRAGVLVIDDAAELGAFAGSEAPSMDLSWRNLIEAGVSPRMMPHVPASFPPLPRLHVG